MTRVWLYRGTGGSTYVQHWYTITPTSGNPANTTGSALVGAGGAGSATIKDYAEPTIEDAGIRAGEIIAYRAWRLRGGYLHSMFVEEYRWTPQAAEHTDPKSVNAGLGLHAFKELDQAQDEYSFYPYQGAITTVYGEVALWGTVYEHEGGYRAEYARITRIIEVHEYKILLQKLGLRKSKTINELRRRYGVEE